MDRETVDAYALGAIGATKGVYEVYIKEEIQRNPKLFAYIAVAIGGLAVGYLSVGRNSGDTVS